MNAGVGGHSLDTLRVRFAREVFPQRPQLVILQTGTIDYLFGLSPETFAPKLRAAIADLLDAGVDVVLLDSQWYPGGGEDARYRAFQQVIAAEGAARGVPVVRRYAWMADMDARRIYTPQQMLATDLFHPSDLAYSCTGRMVAEGLVRTVAGVATR